ncbi:DJ-1/PfpI family protein [Methylobacterium haplocladii]|uniref:Glutamine amidotransferase n=1 Tax=Methylobacterium haplocladii TaxID=1176176 RepID=A0A512IJP2_9HYPH|nr:DJ-1/PfpI family protein [Methylobacterium haplocladii]GEO97926.1 glutamine amidotransferase [Methylobacterium haplocladii]GJD84838.1 Isonitrile hydratase [Methylobacterium haplocladii]GLS58691.1 glutamine amidotransferase [Methylobacterium haplocladii]
MPLQIGLLTFPRVQQLDLTGPYEVFALLPDAEVHLVAKTLDPLTSATGLVLQPTTTLSDCPKLDVICVPGGPGVNAVLTDAPVLDFIRRQAAGARYVTSVCTGSLVLGAAGLLKGRKATTHWGAHDLLSAFGAIPTKGRVVQDGNLVTGGGVTAGIDFALTLVAELVSDDAARAIQLHLEYAPAPPFESGTPERARASVVAAVREKLAASRREREAVIARITR